MSTAQLAEPAALDAVAAAEHRRVRQQAALVAFGRRTAVPPPLGVLLRDALTFLIDACEVEYGLFAEPSDKPGMLDVSTKVCGNGLPAALEISHFGSQSLAFHALDSGMLSVVADLATDQRCADSSLRRLGFVSAVAVPLQHGERRFGVLVLGSTSSKKLTNDDVAFLESVSHLLAFAIARERAEKTLTEERLGNAEICDALPQIVVLLDNQGRILRANRACEELTGFYDQELAGRLLWDTLAAPECSAALEAEFAQTLATDKRLSHASFLLTKHGQRKQLQWTHAVLPSTRVLFTGDVSEERSAESHAATPRPIASPEPKSTSGANRDADAPAGNQPEETASGRDRRRSVRKAFHFHQRIAPYRGTMPMEHEYFLANFSDISAGGVSFILAEKPDYNAVVIELGAPPRSSKMRSDIVRVVPIMDQGRPAYLIGCRFVERI